MEVTPAPSPFLSSYTYLASRFLGVMKFLQALTAAFVAIQYASMGNALSVSLKGPVDPEQQALLQNIVRTRMLKRHIQVVRSVLISSR